MTRSELAAEVTRSSKAMEGSAAEQLGADLAPRAACIAGVGGKATVQLFSMRGRNGEGVVGARRNLVPEFFDEQKFFGLG